MSLTKSLGTQLALSRIAAPTALIEAMRAASTRTGTAWRPQCPQARRLPATVANDSDSQPQEPHCTVSMLAAPENRSGSRWLRCHCMHVGQNVLSSTVNGWTFVVGPSSALQ
jgi:hypothetical protein